MTMLKTAAIKAARKSVGAPIGRQTSWQVYGPYHMTEEGLKGPSTCHHSSSHWAASRDRIEWVACLALCLMGWDEDAAYDATQDTEGKIENIINAALYEAMSPAERLDKAIGRARGKAKETASI